MNNMDFKTKEVYEKHINNLYVDFSPEEIPTYCFQLERHYIYPKYDVFNKEYHEELDGGKFINEFMAGLVMGAILAQTDKKPVEDLTSDEKMGLCVGAGIPMKYENGKYTTTYNVGFALIDNKYKVFYNIDPFNTYC